MGIRNKTRSIRKQYAPSLFCCHEQRAIKLMRELVLVPKVIPVGDDPLKALFFNNRPRSGRDIFPYGLVESDLYNKNTSV